MQKIISITLFIISFLCVILWQNCESRTSHSSTTNQESYAAPLESGHGDIYTGGIGYILPDTHQLCNDGDIYSKIIKNSGEYFLAFDKCKATEILGIDISTDNSKDLQYRGQTYIKESDHDLSNIEAVYFNSCNEIFNFDPDLPFGEYYLEIDGNIEKVNCQAPVQDPIPRITLKLKSEWTSSCSSSPKSTGYASLGKPAISRGLVTSEWDGEPWSCLTAEISTTHPTALFNLHLSSEWKSSGCKAGATTTVQSSMSGDDPVWTTPLVTSEWDGSPWSCLKMSLSSQGTSHSCELILNNYWGTCKTSSVISESGNWSSSIITSEWNGSPWSCLRVRVTCE